MTADALLWCPLCNEPLKVFAEDKTVSWCPGWRMDGTKNDCELQGVSLSEDARLRLAACSSPAPSPRSETERMSEEEFERLASTASIEYEISADAGDCYVDDVNKVKAIVAEARRARAEAAKLREEKERTWKNTARICGEFAAKAEREKARADRAVARERAKGKT